MNTEIRTNNSPSTKTSSDYYFAEVRKIDREGVDSKELARDYENAKINLWVNYIFSSDNVKRSFANFIEVIDKPVISSDYDEVKFNSFVKKFNKITDDEGVIGKDIVADLVRIDVDKVLLNKALEFASCEGDEFFSNVKSYMRKVDRCRSRLIECNLLLVVQIARQYSKKFRHVDFDDLVAEGNLGLFAAAENYNWKSGYNFSTYGTYWIKYYITRNVANKYSNIRIPVGLQEIAYKAKRIIDSENAKENKNLNIEDLAKILGVSVSRAKNALGVLNTTNVSLNSYVVGQGNGSLKSTMVELIDITEDTNHVPATDMIDYSRVYEVFTSAFDALEPMEKFILEKRFGLNGEDEHTLQQIGDMKGYSREGVRRIEERAKGKLKKRIAFHFGEDVLNG